MPSNQELIEQAAQRLSIDLKNLEAALNARRRFNRGEVSESELRAAEFKVRVRKTLIEFGALDNGI